MVGPIRLPPHLSSNSSMFLNTAVSTNVSWLLQWLMTTHLRLYLPTLDPAHQPHPGEHLRHGEGQGEVVGDIVIASCTQLLFQAFPLQGTHAPFTQDVGGGAALVQPSPGGDGDGGRSLVLPRSTCCHHSS